MSSSDDDFPEVDLTDDMMVINDDEPRTGELLGAPPDSDYDDAEYMTPTPPENNEEFEYNWGRNTYESGSEDFDIEEYENDLMADLHIHELSNMHVGNEQVEVPQQIEEFDKNTEDFLRVLLPSAMVADIEHMRTGFEPADIDKCLKDVGYCIDTMCGLLLGQEEYLKMPPVQIERCYVLVKANFLRAVDGKFYPAVPESMNDHIAALIDGAAQLARHEETRKKTFETYESEEQEIHILHTFNMIAKLLHAVREDQRQERISYSFLQNAYKDMVTGEKYHSIFEEYHKLLRLSPEKQWNPEWFVHNTKRSSLQKFVRMAKFSEIVISNSNPTTIYFRADDDHGREVRLFLEKDFEEVRKKWRSGQENNKNYGDNTRSGGQRGEYRGSSRPKEKKQIEQDPNYRSARFGEDRYDGSREPSTSTRHNDHRSPPRRIRNRSPTGSHRDNSEPRPIRNRSPSRSRSPSPYATNTRGQKEAARDASPESERSERSERPDPFSGRPVQRKEEPKEQTNRNGGYSNTRDTRDNRGAQSNQPVKRLENQMIGETSSEGEFTSDGSYSNEDEETKLAKRERRLASKKKKEEREIRRRKDREEKGNRPLAFNNRFQKYNKSRRQEAEKSPEPRRRQSSNSENEAPAPAPPPQPTAAVQKPVAPALSDSDSDYTPPVTQPKTIQAPVVSTTSMYNENAHQAQIPYRPAASDVEKKKMEEIEKQAKRQAKYEKKRNEQAPVVNQQVVHPAPIQPNQSGYDAPREPAGFGGPSSARPPYQEPQRQPFDENYCGRNQQPVQQNQQRLQSYQQPHNQQQNYQNSHNQPQRQQSAFQQYQNPRNLPYEPERAPSRNANDRDYNNGRLPQHSQSVVCFNPNRDPRRDQRYEDDRRGSRFDDDRRGQYRDERRDDFQRPLRNFSPDDVFNTNRQRDFGGFPRNQPHQPQDRFRDQQNEYRLEDEYFSSNNRQSSSNQCQNFDHFDSRAPQPMHHYSNQGPFEDNRRQINKTEISTFRSGNATRRDPSDYEEKMCVLIERVEDNLGHFYADRLLNEFRRNFSHDFPPHFDPIRYIKNRMSDRVVQEQSTGVELFKRLF